jgi:SAM-dependent methyltransferase
MSGIEILVYDNEFDFEYSYGVWGRLRDRSFDAVVVFGRETTEDKHELLAANFLSAKERSYLKADGSQEDISSWRDHVVMNTEPGPVRIRRLAESDGAAYRQRVNKWAAETVAKTNFNVVEGKRDRIGNLSGYSSVPMLANDLGMQTPHLHRDQFGVSWGHFMLPNGQFCVTPDYHRAIANYVNAIPDVRSVIDVGCGSGFASFHLANNPRYDRVVGVDGAGPRATSAEFHAKLHNNRAEYFAMDMAKLDFPAKSFDVTITCAALEQSCDFLDDALAELLRVTRKMLVLVEPTIEYFSTFPGYINVLTNGWARGYSQNLVRLGRPFAVRPYIFSHYYNPVSMMVINAEDDAYPAARYPELFDFAVEAWPGGITEI